MKLWDRPKKLFKAQVPKLDKYIGRDILIDGLVVKIKKIVGNRTSRAFYEINDEHLIGMLRFHAQVEGAKDITEQQFKDFEDMIMDAEKLPDAPPKKFPGQL